MTTPVPTTAAAHLAMVEALRDAIGVLAAIATGSPETYEGRMAQTYARSVQRDLRAALEGWEKRPRLRDNRALKSAVWQVLVYGLDSYSPAMGYTRLTDAILDALEPLLFGTGPRTGGERGEGGDCG